MNLAQIVLKTAMCLLGFAPTIAWAGALTFSAPQDFGTGPIPIAVIAADINGDGKPDLITANNNNATVTVLLNTTPVGGATQSFGLQQSFQVGMIPKAVAAADINADGKPDLVVVNSFDNTISVLLNTTGTGATNASFRAQQTFVTDYFPVAIAIADVNGDGKPDLIVAIDARSDVEVFLNTTQPGATTAEFTPSQIFPTGSRPRSVVAVDVDGDGKPDIVTANTFDDNTVSVLLNTTPAGATTASFAAQKVFATGKTPSVVASADINGDGKPDLIVVNSEFSAHSVSVLLNTSVPGGVNFSQQQPFVLRSASTALAIADLNGDGKPDLIAPTSASEFGVSILLNTTPALATTPSFAAEQAFSVASMPFAVTAADLNGDGRADLVVADSDTVSSSVVSILLNTGSRVVLNQHGLTGSWYNPATGGQGFEIETYPDVGGAGKGSLFAGWFTFPTSASLARRWYGLTGDVSSTSPAAKLQVFDVEGGNLNAPPSVGPKGALGEATIQFADCNTGALVYKFTDTDGSARAGTIPLVRLTPNVTCTPTGDSGAPASSYLLSGNWYNPAASGQGFMFDFSPSINGLFAAWYTFVFKGQQLGGPASQNWFTLQSGAFAPGTTSLNDIPIVETISGAFDKPDPTTSFQAGTANISLQSCNAMTLSYTFKAGENKGVSGSVNLQRVGPVPQGCSLSP